MGKESKAVRLSRKRLAILLAFFIVSLPISALINAIFRIPFIPIFDLIRIALGVTQPYTPAYNLASSISWVLSILLTSLALTLFVYIFLNGKD